MRWDVDDTPARAFTRAYVRWMWLNRDKRAFEGEARTLRTALDLQRRGDSPPTRWTGLRHRVAAQRHSGMTVWSVQPRRAEPRARVFYVHGGGYVHPLTRDYWRLVRTLASAPATVVVPAYPLAPDAGVDDVLPRLLAVEEQTRSGLPTVLMGDSAGGALAFAMAAAMRARGASAAAAVVGLCPWLDATLADEEVRSLEPSDPMLAETGLRASGRWWAAPRTPDDPAVSPVHADLHGLPPLEVWIGRRDILRPAVSRLADRARTEGFDLRVHEVAAMFHVWMTRAVPEGRTTRRALVELVRRYAGVDP